MKYKFFSLFTLIIIIFISCKKSTSDDTLKVCFNNFNCYLFDYKNNLTYTPKEFYSGGIEIEIINKSEFDYVISDLKDIQLFNSDQKLMPYNLDVIKFNEKIILNENKINLLKRDTIRIYFKFEDLYLKSFIEYEEFINRLKQDENMEKLCFRIKLNNEYKKIDVFFDEKTKFLFFKNDNLVDKFTEVENIGLPPGHARP